MDMGKSFAKHISLSFVMFGSLPRTWKIWEASHGVNTQIRQKIKYTQEKENPQGKKSFM